MLEGNATVKFLLIVPEGIEIRQNGSNDVGKLLLIVPEGIEIF